MFNDIEKHIQVNKNMNFPLANMQKHEQHEKWKYGSKYVKKIFKLDSDQRNIN